MHSPTACQVKPGRPGLRELRRAGRAMLHAPGSANRCCEQGMPGSYPSNYMPGPQSPPGYVMQGTNAPQGSIYNNSYPMWNQGVHPSATLHSPCDVVAVCADYIAAGLGALCQTCRADQLMSSASLRCSAQAPPCRLRPTRLLHRLGPPTLRPRPEGRSRACYQPR